MFHTIPRTTGRTSYLFGAVRRWVWGENVNGPAKVYRNGREWDEGVTRLFTVFGFGVAEYDRRDERGNFFFRRDKHGKPCGIARGRAFGFFRVEPPSVTAEVPVCTGSAGGGELSMSTLVIQDGRVVAIR